MFEEYLKYNNIPSGAILDRIRRKRSLSQRKLAESAGLSPQRLNNYIHKPPENVAASIGKAKQSPQIKR